MGPDWPLPFNDSFTSTIEYIASLLKFGTHSQLLHILTGGVHILDFFTQDPDAYSSILPHEWREYFKSLDIDDILDLLLREDLKVFNDDAEASRERPQWRGVGIPPRSLLVYIEEVRRHCLERDIKVNTSQQSQSNIKSVRFGMNPKKLHEVEYFTQWLDRFDKELRSGGRHGISHFVDFGSGQNFLGRALACVPFNKNVIAVESRPHVVQTAKRRDIVAKLASRPKNQANKKAFRRAVASGQAFASDPSSKSSRNPHFTNSNGYNIKTSDYVDTVRATIEAPATSGEGSGNVQYVEHSIKDGDLSAVVDQIIDPQSNDKDPSSRRDISHPQALMVMSIHSCGNLSHHGLRSLTRNPSVEAVAMIGCCYNLLGERYGPNTYKLPDLRPQYPHVEVSGSLHDEHGFPISKRFCDYTYPATRSRRIERTSLSSSSSDDKVSTATETGLRLNITSRMLSVQSPSNWNPAERSSFFTRHFYRALLQRIFLDLGIISPPHSSAAGVSPAGSSSDREGTEPIVIGSLPKKAYESFTSYVRTAVSKIVSHANAESPTSAVKERAALIRSRLSTQTDAQINEYESKYSNRKKELSIVWSLMSFSAGVIESLIAVDRYCWLVEQPCVEKAWVEAVFEYALSPRNLVVVGVKKRRS